MRAFLFTLLTLPAVSAFADGEPVPTVIVDIHALGAERVEALKRAPGVTWSAEFGNEMLLGVSPQSLNDVLKNQRARPGPAALAFDEVVVRDHACAALDHDHEAAIAVVGGYEILRKSPAQARATRGVALPGEPLPIDGVVAREVRNERVQKGAAAPVIEVQNLVARVDGDRWHDTMSALAAFNRNTFNPNLPLARDWILQRFSDAALEPQTFNFTMSASTCGGTATTIQTANPIGFKRGQTAPDEWIVVGAHYDARNEDRLCDPQTNPAHAQPGANDNASGCAGVIELARVFSNMATQRSILFMCFTGEEQGLAGSRIYLAQIPLADRAKIKHMINLDMIGHAVDDTLAARVDTNGAQAAVLPLYAAAAATYAPELSLITTTSAIANSDHSPFLDAGIPSAFTWENGAGIYLHYHKSTDVPANMQRARPLAKGILKMDTAVLASVAGLLPLFADSFGD